MRRVLSTRLTRLICLLALISTSVGVVLTGSGSVSFESRAREDRISTTDVAVQVVDSESEGQGAVPNAPQANAAASDNSESETSGLCPNPRRRQEWRDLSRAEKASYISAVKCLQRLPAVTKLPAVKSQFDDFQALHVAMTYQIHWVGQFIHWHRRMVQLYETKLRENCGYQGAQPYWDWTRDADTGTILNSPIFDPITGFGGNGADIPGGYRGLFGNSTEVSETGGGCLVDGPFKGFNLTVGPGTNNTNHCLTRAISDRVIDVMTTAQVQNTTKQPTFELFRQELGGAFKPPPFKVHDGGHAGISGEMGSVFSSPGDPLFYLHHTALDRVFWLWQEKDRPKRLTEVSGNAIFNTTTPELTLDWVLEMDKIGPPLRVRDVMDTRGKAMCYVYV